MIIYLGKRASCRYINLSLLVYHISGGLSIRSFTDPASVGQLRRSRRSSFHIPGRSEGRRTGRCPRRARSGTPCRWGSRTRGARRRSTRRRRGSPRGGGGG